MPAVIIATDTVIGTSASSTSQGLTITRGFLVQFQDASGNPERTSGTLSQRLYEAMLICPLYGTKHPTLPVFVSNVVPRIEDASTATFRVEVSYTTQSFELLNQTPSEDSPNTSQTWGATAISVEASHTPNVAAGDPGWLLKYTTSAGKALEDQPFKASVQIPILTFTATRPEPLNFVRDKIKNNVGRVNANQWNLLGMKHWLCNSIVSELRAGYVIMKYSFLGNLYYTWDPRGVYQDPVTKAPFKELVGGVTKVAPEQTFLFYDTADFNGLNLGV